MTAAAQFAARNGDMEYVLCIEGFGWCANEASGYAGSEDGFLGDVFVTADLNGDIAAKLSGGSLAVHGGMMLPSSVGESIDRLTLQKSRDGITFELVDDDGFIRREMLPLSTTIETQLSTALEPKDPQLFLADGSEYPSGSTVWLGGRERVRLGERSGSGPHQYDFCTRGYLGTPIGRIDESFSSSGLTWAMGVVAQSRCRFLYGRRVRLYAHAPGVAASDGGCLLLYSGAIRGGFSSDRGGVLWSLATVAEDVTTSGRVRRVTTDPLISFHEYVREDGRTFHPSGYGNGPGTPPTAIVLTDAGAGVKIKAAIYLGGIGAERIKDAYRQIYAMYHYRGEPGGTAGMLALAVSPGSNLPQAPSVDGVDYVIDRWLLVDGQLMRAAAMYESGGSTPGAKWITVDPRNPYGAHHLDFAALPGSNTPARILLDNIGDDWRLSRFAVNREVRRNPIDVFLMFLLSTPGEFIIGDAQTSSTTSRVIFANGLLGAADRWNGYALHCVEGDNKGYARVITDSTTGSGNYVDVYPPFPSAPASGDEYQIRNSIYDVLPLGWGMGIHHSKVDVASCDRTRSRYLADAALGKFMIGDKDDVDLWKTIQENILSPYQLAARTVRQTGKLDLRYIGQPLTDGIVDDYVAISEEHVTEVGDIDHGASLPLGRITVRTRKAANVLVNSVRSTPVTSAVDPFRTTTNDYARAQGPLLDGNETSVVVQSPEISGAYGSSGFAEIEITALFNSEDDLDHVITLAYGLLRREASPPPTTSFRATLDIAPYVQAGDLLSFTKADVLDPFTGEVGTLQCTARVLSVQMSLSQTAPGLDVGIELMSATAGARIAPALAVESEGSDGNGDWVRCQALAYTNDPERPDHMSFATGDAVELRDSTGALKESLGTITGFGTGEAAAPADAVLESSGTLVRIYVSSAPTSVAVGDYITFRQWPNATTRQKGYYSAYADAAGVLGTNDEAKGYG